MRNYCQKTHGFLTILLTVFMIIGVAATSAVADPFFFSTGNPDGLVGTGSRPASTGKIEIESADDFLLISTTIINSATFTGLLTGSTSTPDRVIVEIYRNFPKDSDVGRTSGSGLFGTPKVTSRNPSPSDIAFDSRDSSAGTLSFTTSILNNNFRVGNTVLNGIYPRPNQQTGGEGAANGKEVLFHVTFATPFSLNPDDYFFVPQVEVTGGEFLWLSAPFPHLPPFSPDWRSFIRNENLAPDWSGVGINIIGHDLPQGVGFNAAFSLTGTVPEPASMFLLGCGLISLIGLRRKIIK